MRSGRTGPNCAPLCDILTGEVLFFQLVLRDPANRTIIVSVRSSPAFFSRCCTTALFHLLAKVLEAREVLISLEIKVHFLVQHLGGGYCWLCSKVPCLCEKVFWCYFHIPTLLCGNSQLFLVPGIVYICCDRSCIHSSHILYKRFSISSPGAFSLCVAA